MSDVLARRLGGTARDDGSTVESAATDDGRTVSYAEYGASGGAPLVFLHGTPGSRLLGALLDEPARRHGVRVLSPDRPGYGRSDPWPTRTLSDAGAVVAAVLDDAGVRRAGVVGFSGGGPHALAVAATRGDRVRDVDVVAGTPPPALGAPSPPALRLLEALAGTAPCLLKGLLWVQAWLARRAPPSLVASLYTMGGAELPDNVADLVRRDFVEAFATHRSGFVTETRLLARAWDVPLDRIERPVGVWHGGRDANVPVDGARRLAERLPNARTVVFDEADHLGTLLRARSRVLHRHAAGD